MNDQQLLRYSRHILLDEFGIEGQQRLLDATALIVGAGGLGSPAALYLASAGIGRIILADADTVDLTNLQRQILHSTDSVGLAKVDSARQRLHAINPDVEVIALPERLDDGNLDAQVARSTVVLDCSDNFDTRHAVNRACVRHGVPLVSGAAIRFDGQIGVFDSRTGGACYECLFPHSQETDEVRCSTMGVFAPLTGIIGSVQAAEAIKLVTGIGRSLTSRLVLLDALDMSWSEVRAVRDPDCEVCSMDPATLMKMD
ncbi:molybdopterin-synthase adenylyltransferase MoeB [soil metagenome]